MSEDVQLKILFDCSRGSGVQLSQIIIRWETLARVLWQLLEAPVSDFPKLISWECRAGGQYLALSRSWMARIKVRTLAVGLLPLVR